MTLEQLVAARVRVYYGGHDLSCIHATLKVLAEVFDTEVSPQTYDSSSGMFGGGGNYGAQCGLVQGVIMFIGILCARHRLDKETLGKLCFDYSALAEKELGSLLCREIRPEGFTEDNPPDLCEPRTVQSIVSAARFIADRFRLPLNLPR